MTKNLWILIWLLLATPALFGQTSKWSRASVYIKQPSNDANRRQRILRTSEHARRILESSSDRNNPLLRLLYIVSQRQRTLFPFEGPWQRDQYGALDVLLVATSRVIDKGLPIKNPPTYDLSKEELKELTYRFTPGTNEENLPFRAGALRIIGMAIVDGEPLATPEEMAPLDRLIQPKNKRRVEDALKVQELFDKLSQFISSARPVNPQRNKRRRSRQKSWPYILAALILFLSCSFFLWRRYKKPTRALEQTEDVLGEPTPPPNISAQELLDGLAALHAECIHALKGRLATAEVFREEPERFAAHFLAEETLNELIEDLKSDDGPTARINSLLERREQCGDDVSPILASACEKLSDHRRFYERLIDILEKVRTRKSNGQSIDIEKFMTGLRKLADQLKSISEALKCLLAKFEVDLGGLLHTRAEALLPESMLGKVDIQEGLVRRCASPESESSEIVKMFDILLTNALEAKPNKIELLGSSVFADGEEMLQFIITDDGMGAEQQALDKAFERGFTTRDKGTGTGLWWSRRFMEARKGNIKLSSDGPGKGASLTLRLPSLL